MPRNQIDGAQVLDNSIERVDLADEVRFRTESIQYPIDIELTIINEARLFRAECLIIKPTGKVTIQAGGRVIIKR
jgi:hypothetical protein